MSQILSDSFQNETSFNGEIHVVPSPINLNNLLSYQDVMKTIEREFHLGEGQEREIIMKLWLKSQTMLSILQRYRYLLQDLNLNDEDFISGFKQIRDLIIHSNHDAQFLRERVAMLENQNVFLEQEFQRQLDRISHEKNEQILRLSEIVGTGFSTSREKNPDNSEKNHFHQEEILKKFIEKNSELQNEIETLQTKLEYTFKLLSQKLEEQNQSELIQTTVQKIQQTEKKLREYQWKLSQQHDENQMLKYLIEKTDRNNDAENLDLIRKVEENSLEREIKRVQSELEQTESRTAQLEIRFDKTDENQRFKFEEMKLNCEVLRSHVEKCLERLNEIKSSNNDRQEKKNFEEICSMRQRCNELVEQNNKIKAELTEARKRIQQQEKSQNFEILYDQLKQRYDELSQRFDGEKSQLIRVKSLLEEKSFSCEKLENEKFRKKMSEITKKSQSISMNLTQITSKYKEKLDGAKKRLELVENQYRELKTRHEIIHKEYLELREQIAENQENFQKAQLQQREFTLEKENLEHRRTADLEQIQTLTNRNRFLEEEFQRLQRQIFQLESDRRNDHLQTEIENQLEQLKSKIHQTEEKLSEEKTLRESLQIQMKLLEEENIDLREIMTQMRKRRHDELNCDDRDRNDQIQQLIARTEQNARQFMNNFNLTHFSTPSALVRLVPVSTTTS